MTCPNCKYLQERVNELERRRDHYLRTIEEERRSHPRNTLPRLARLGVESVEEAIADGYVTDANTLEEHVNEFCDSSLTYTSDQWDICTYGDTNNVEDWGSESLDAKVTEAAYQILQAELWEELRVRQICDKYGEPILPAAAV